MAGATLFALLAWLAARELMPESSPAICEALAKARIVRVVAFEEAFVRCAGLRVVPADEQLSAALRADAEEPLVAALQATKGTAVAVPHGDFPGLAGRLAAREHVPGLRGIALAPELSVYAPRHEPTLSFREREALAYVARALLRGAREPSVASFPAALRRVERVEVMVLLSRRGEPRLWRSARATSIARALLTATRVARERWREREQAMGGPLSERLLHLDVEVILLAEDGTLVSTDRAFLGSAVHEVHGIGFDHRTAWHYVLPSEVARQGGAFEALSSQLDEQGLTLASLEHEASRLYRFVTVPLGVSKAPLDAGR